MVFRDFHPDDYEQLLRLWDELEVHKANLAAIKLYKKCGFRQFPDYDLYMIRKPTEIQID